MIGQRLTMRAAIERNGATAKDGWGQPVAPAFASIGAAVPCFVYSKSGRPIVDGGKVAMIEQLRAMFALDADVRDQDEIAALTDRRGTVIIPGRLKVDGPVQRVHTHLEVNLRIID